MSLRAASKQLREDVFRERWSGTSNQANLAVSYLDAYGFEVVERLRPKSWPRTIIVDSTALTTGGYRDEPPDKDGAEKSEAEQRSGGLKAGTIMVAIDGTRRSRPPVLIQVQGGKDTESWRAFFRYWAARRSGWSQTSTRQSPAPCVRLGRRRGSTTRVSTWLA